MVERTIFRYESPLTVKLVSCGKLPINLNELQTAFATIDTANIKLQAPLIIEREIYSEPTTTPYSNTNVISKDIIKRKTLRQVLTNCYIRLKRWLTAMSTGTKSPQEPVRPSAQEPLSSTPSLMFERAELQKYLRDKLIDIDLTFILCELASKNSVELATITGAVVSASDSFSIGVVILPTKINNISELQLFSYELQKVRDAMKICIVVPSLEYTEHKHIIECLKRFIEIFVRSGLVNLDLADLSTIVKGGYVAAIGSCETTEEVIDTKNRVLTAINTILKSPIFLIDLRMCSKVLVNVTGGPSMTLEEAEGCARVINKLVPTHTRIIWGATIDTTIATGLRVVLVAGIPPEHALLQVYTRD